MYEIIHWKWNVWIIILSSNEHVLPSDKYLLSYVVDSCRDKCVFSCKICFNSRPILTKAGENTLTSETFQH
jgi:hypothetical protein